jgi:hypothetical protein
MNYLKLIIAALLIFLLFFNGCIVNIVGTDAISRVSTDTDPSIIKLISLALLAVYEVVVRVVPSVGDYSIVSWLIKALKKVSDALNVTK